MKPYFETEPCAGVVRELFENKNNVPKVHNLRDVLENFTRSIMFVRTQAARLPMANSVPIALAIIMLAPFAFVVPDILSNPTEE